MFHVEQSLARANSGAAARESALSPTRRPRTRVAPSVPHPGDPNPFRRAKDARLLRSARNTERTQQRAAHTRPGTRMGGGRRQGAATTPDARWREGHWPPPTDARQIVYYSVDKPGYPERAGADCSGRATVPNGEESATAVLHDGSYGRDHEINRPRGWTGGPTAHVAYQVHGRVAPAALSHLRWCLRHPGPA